VLNIHQKEGAFLYYALRSHKDSRMVYLSKNHLLNKLSALQVIFLKNELNNKKNFQFSNFENVYNNIQLTEYSRVLNEKIVVAQLTKKLHVRWVRCNQSMAHPQVADGGKSSGYGG
jgi:hypothetical protein